MDADSFHKPILREALNRFFSINALCPHCAEGNCPLHMGS
jgi:hypothetical protein